MSAAPRGGRGAGPGETVLGWRRRQGRGVGSFSLSPEDGGLRRVLCHYKSVLFDKMDGSMDYLPIILSPSFNHENCREAQINPSASQCRSRLSTFLSHVSRAAEAEDEDQRGPVKQTSIPNLSAVTNTRILFKARFFKGFESSGESSQLIECDSLVEETGLVAG